MLNRLLSILVLICCGSTLIAQELHYSAPEPGVDQIIKYKSIGRVGKNILLSKERKNKEVISVFQNDMSLLRDVELSTLPKNLLDVDYINLGDNVIMIYQYLDNSKLFLSYLKLDENGKVIIDPIKIDSSLIENITEFPLYQTVANAAKNMLMFIYMNDADEQVVKMKALLYDSKMIKLETSSIIINTQGSSEKPNQFQLDNNGNLIFVRNISDNESNISRSDILVKLKGNNEIKNAAIEFNKIGVKEIRTTIDNINNQIITAAVFFAGKKMTAQGIFSTLVDIKTGNVSNWQQNFFSDSLRKELKMKHTPYNRTFDDYYLDQIIPFTNGGFTLILEQRITEGNRGGMTDNRSFISDPLPPRVVYNGNSGDGALFSIIGSPHQAFIFPIESSSRSYIRNVAGNVLIFSLNKESMLNDIQVLRKEQDEVRSSHTISYALIKSAAGIKFLYNEKEKNELSLRSANFIPDSRLKRNPAVKGTIPNMRFLPRYATQIGTNECIIPVVKSSIGSFARISF